MATYKSRFTGAQIDAALGMAANALPKSGGTMTGVIAMGGKKITGIANGTTATDAAAYGQIVEAASGTNFYGVCSTEADTQAKTVDIPGVTELAEGLGICVNFTNAQTYNGVPTLNVNGLGAKSVHSLSGTDAASGAWDEGEIVRFIYDGTYWVLEDGGTATTTRYGVTKLSAATNSTSNLLAATPGAVKLAYDLANGKQDALTFDTAPAENSTNPVTSGGVYTALSTLSDVVDGKQDALTFDAAPTNNSTNPVTSGGVYTALSGKEPNIAKGTISTGTTWSGSGTGPFTQTVTVSGASVTAKSKVDLQPDAAAFAQLLSDHVKAIFISNNSGTLTAYAVGRKPTAAITFQCTVMEVT